MYFYLHDDIVYFFSPYDRTGIYSLLQFIHIAPF